MPYPESFYYSESSSKPHYTRSPTGRLDVNQLVKNKAPWIVPTSVEKKPKTLIITDWRARGWTFGKTEAIIEAVKALIDKGFTLYIWQNGELVPLLKDNYEEILSSQEHREKLGPVLGEDVLSTACEHYKIPREQIQIFDEFCIDNLFGNKIIEMQQKEFLCWRDFIHLSVTEIDKLKILLEKNYSINTIICDEFGFENPILATHIQDFIRSLKGLSPIRSINTSADISFGYLSTVLQDKTIEKLKTDLIALQELKLSNITRGISDPVIALLNHLLNTLPFFRVLDLSSSSMSEAFLLKLTSLQKLSKINLPAAGLTELSLQHVFNSGPNLKSVTLQYLKQLKSTPRINTKLLKLKELNLGKGAFEYAFLQTVLDATPNLKRLNLNQCQFPNSEHFITVPRLPQLECLDIGKSNISAQDLYALILASPNLKRLTCSGGISTQLPPNWLHNLEELDISDSDITSEQLAFILQAAPNLKKLTLTGCTKLNGSWGLLANSLAKLESLTITKCAIKSSGLEALIHAAPNLRTFTFSQGTYNINTLTLSSQCLKKLEHLNCVECGLGTKAIESLLHLTTNIKSLDFFCSQSFPSVVFDNSYHFPFLNKAYFPLSNFAHSLTNLLKVAPNIKELGLERVAELKPSVGRYIDKIFENVEVIDLSHIESLASSELERLLKMFPQMKTLDLSTAYITDIPGVMNLAPNSLPKLQKLIVDTPLIPIRCYESIINAAPLLKANSTPSDAAGLAEGQGTDPEVMNRLDMSADTSLDPNLTYNVDEIFSPIGHSLVPDVRNYRLNVYQNINVNPAICDSTAPVTLEHVGDLNLTIPPQLNKGNTPVSALPGHQLYRGKQPLHITKAWQPLASLSAQEVMLAYKMIPDAEVEIQYSKRDNLYYIRGTTEKSFDTSIEMTLSVPEKKIIACDPQVQALIQYHLGFQPGTLVLPNKPLTGADYLDAISKQKIGSCFHRSVAFKNEMQARFPSIPVRIPTNSCHVFVELYIDGNWLACDLDGYPATINIKNKVSTAFNVNTINFAALAQNKGEEIDGQYYYLGAKLPHFLSTLEKPCTFYNPWQGFHIEPGAVKGTWFIWGASKDKKELITQEQLLKELVHRLGPSISIIAKEDETRFIQQSPYIESLDSFIKEGGLLSLCLADNQKIILHEISQLKSLTCSQDALSGLLLKDLQGHPAWMKGMNDMQTAKFTYRLLMQFVALNPNTFEKELLSSMEGLSDKVRKSLLVGIKNYLRSASSDLIQNPGHKKLYSLFRKADYEFYFKPQEKRESIAGTNWQAYCHSLLNVGPAVKKQLIKLTSNDALRGLRFGLERIAKMTSRPIFYINSAEDLICNAPYIARNGQVGRLQKGPGGRLYDFLIANKDNSPVLVVNYANFRAEEIVQFNELLDKERRIQGITLPVNALVVGLMNVNKEGCYHGADFTSRFDAIASCSLAKEELKKAIMEPVVVAKSVQAAINKPINLFHSSDWKSLLLGRWILNGNNLSYDDGELPKLLQTVEIENGLWGDEDFNTFWQEAMLRGEIVHEGQIYKLASDFKLIKSEGYNWPELKKNLRMQTNVSPEEQILNPGCLSQFFSHYQFNTTHKNLGSVPGFIELAKKQGGVLAVYLTRDISQDDWARLMAECQKHQLILNLRLAPGLELPESLRDLTLPRTNTLAPSVAAGNLQQPTAIILSNDINVTVMKLTQDKSKDYHVIDVSECQPEDLLERLDAAFNPLTLQFDFKQRQGILSDPVNASKNIILKGRFSAELADKMTAILIKRFKNPPSKGQWILVSDNTKVFSHLPFSKHMVTDVEKIKSLQLSTEEQGHLSFSIRNESQAQLQARQIFLKAKLGDPWNGMSHIPAFKGHWGPLSTNTAAEAQAWTLKRFQAVKAHLTAYPFVFLTGLSGVGKTTFITKILGKNTKVHMGDQNKLAWALDKTPGTKVLFIDEENLSGADRSEFEGLFQTPPRILIDGQLHELTPSHKVIFAGNPSSYGDERRLGSFFKQRGGALLFEPLPAANLYEDVLKPLFPSTVKPELVLAVCSHFLSIYGFLVEHSTHDILISPRELQMMALLTVSFCQKHPKADALAVAKHYGYLVAKHVVPATLQTVFEQRFKVPAVNAPMEVASASYLITPSRQEAATQLHEFLNLRQWRQDTSNLNDEQKYGGLGALVFEGAPGMGKSELVIHILIQHGFQEVHAQQPLPNKPFYRMPVSLSYSEKEALLLKAFHEGAVVVIDEINSAPMMERLLNDLLMGAAPDGKRPLKPGFMVIGTQNPITMAGRRKMSTALSRRMNTLVLPDYSEMEMADILKKKSVSLLEIDPMISTFFKTRKTAKEQFLAEAPSFRDLLSVTEKVGAEQKSPSISTVSQLSSSSSSAAFFNEAVKRKGDIPVDVPEDNSPEEGSYKRVKRDAANSLPEIKAPPSLAFLPPKESVRMEDKPAVIGNIYHQVLF